MSSCLTAGRLYSLCLRAKPSFGKRWFTIADTGTRLMLAVAAFYRFLFTEPLSLAYFAFGWNSLWYGPIFGPILTLFLPILPFVVMFGELVKRLNEKVNPWKESDWKMAGPGRVFFVRPDSFMASLFWDFYLAISVFAGSFLQFGTDRDGLMHTWYDTVTTKEYWLDLLDQAGARRPQQLGWWDGEQLHEMAQGVNLSRADLVCKLSDSFLGIGDIVLRRGTDFDSIEDVQRRLQAEPRYAGKKAILTEMVTPLETAGLSSPGFSSVHSLDILTTRTREGVRVLTVLLWTDCTGWSSHSCTAGYVVDVETETVIEGAAWYAPYFASQQTTLLGVKLPGVKEACERAVAAHAASSLPWLTTVGWDAMLTPHGVYFFEGNVAAYRVPRRVFLNPALFREFFLQYRGKDSPVPWRGSHAKPAVPAAGGSLVDHSLTKLRPAASAA